VAKIISKSKRLEKENEKLRDALVDSLMPLYIMSKYYGRASLKVEAIQQAKDALRKAKIALEFDADDMAAYTDTEEEEWIEMSKEIEDWIRKIMEDTDDTDD
jgi:hypothetical protein